MFLFILFYNKQMNKCETDLEKSRQVREKQAKEFHRQIEELKNEHKKEVK
jgi:hypothetical protein